MLKEKGGCNTNLLGPCQTKDAVPTHRMHGAGRRLDSGTARSFMLWILPHVQRPPIVLLPWWISCIQIYLWRVTFFCEGAMGFLFKAGFKECVHFAYPRCKSFKFQIDVTGMMQWRYTGLRGGQHTIRHQPPKDTTAMPIHPEFTSWTRANWRAGNAVLTMTRWKQLCSTQMPGANAGGREHLLWNEQSV